MASTAKKKDVSPEDFVVMGRTRALLGEVWDLWRKDLRHTPDAAKAMITAGVKEFHKAEAGVKKTAKKKTAQAKRAVKKAVKKTARKAGVKKTKTKKHKAKA